MKTIKKKTIKVWAVFGSNEEIIKFADGELAVFYDRSMGIGFVNKAEDLQGNKIWKLIPCEIHTPEKWEKKKIRELIPCDSEYEKLRKNKQINKV